MYFDCKLAVNLYCGDKGLNTLCESVTDNVSFFLKLMHADGKSNRIGNISCVWLLLKLDLGDYVSNSFRNIQTIDDLFSKSIYSLLYTN